MPDYTHRIRKRDDNTAHPIWIDRTEKNLFYVALALLLSAMFLALINAQLSGMVIKRDANTIYFSLLPKDVSCITFLLGPSTNVLEGTTVNFVIYCENCGNKVSRGTTQLVLKNDAGIVIYEAKSLEYELKMGETHKFTSAWYAQPAGEYVAEAYCFLGDSVKKRAKRIRVYIPPPKEEVYAPVPALPKKAEIKIVSPPFINVSQSSKIPVLVEVKNTGNININNLMLTARSDEDIRIVSVTPPVVEKLDITKSALFVLLLEISQEADTGNHTLYIDAISDEANASAQITLQVSINTLKEKAKNMIEYYEAVLEKLEDEINQTAEEGKNVSDARFWLEKCWKDLNTAKKLYDIWMYKEAINKLGDVNEDIRRAVEELMRARAVTPPPQKIELPAWLPKLLAYIILVLVSAVALIIIALMHRRKKYIMHYRFVPVKRW